MYLQPVKFVMPKFSRFFCKPSYYIDDASCNWHWQSLALHIPLKKFSSLDNKQHCPEFLHDMKLENHFCSYDLNFKAQHLECQLLLP